MPPNLLNASEAEGLVKTFLSSELALWIFIASCVGFAFYLVYKSVLYATFLLRLALGAIVVCGVFVGGFHLWLSTSAPVYLVIPGDPSGPLLLHGLDQARLVWRESQATLDSAVEDDYEDEGEGDENRPTLHNKRRSLCDPQGNCPIDPASLRIVFSEPLPLFPAFDPYAEAMKQRAASNEPQQPQQPQQQQQPQQSHQPQQPQQTSTPSPLPPSPSTSPPRQEAKPATPTKHKDKPSHRKKDKPKPADSTSWRSRFKFRNLLPAPVKRLLDTYWFG